jgi:hypothetical protein
VIQDEEAESEEEDEKFTRVFLGLQPRQRLILAVLLFFDVALCGCMGLVMIGRVLPRL